MSMFSIDNELAPMSGNDKNIINDHGLYRIIHNFLMISSLGYAFKSQLYYNLMEFSLNL